MNDSQRDNNYTYSYSSVQDYNKSFTTGLIQSLGIDTAYVYTFLFWIDSWAGLVKKSFSTMRGSHLRGDVFWELDSWRSFCYHLVERANNLCKTANNFRIWWLVDSVNAVDTFSYEMEVILNQNCQTLSRPGDPLISVALAFYLRLTK